MRLLGPSQRIPNLRSPSKGRHPLRVPLLRRGQCGALNTRDTDDGAVGNRDARFVLGIKGAWGAGERNADAYRLWVREAWQRLRPFSTGASYVNFQSADEDDARIQAAYGSNLHRVVELKGKYDPDNLFRVNRNIHHRMMLAKIIRDPSTKG